MRLKGQNWYLDVEGHGKMWYKTEREAKSGKVEMQLDFPDLAIEGPTYVAPRKRRESLDSVYRSLGMTKVKGCVSGETYWE
jgi:hypothetical protein